MESNARDRAQRAITRAEERNDAAITPDNAVSPYDAAATTILPMSSGAPAGATALTAPCAVPPTGAARRRPANIRVLPGRRPRDPVTTPVAVADLTLSRAAPEPDAPPTAPLPGPGAAPGQTTGPGDAMPTAPVTTVPDDANDPTRPVGTARPADEPDTVAAPGPAHAEAEHGIASPAPPPAAVSAPRRHRPWWKRLLGRA